MMVKVNLMTQKQYAEHRGCSPVSVHKAVKGGRISLIGDRIDPAVADIQWAANSRARAPSRPAAAGGAGPQVAPAPGTSAVDQPPSVAGRDGEYWDSRSRREKAEAAIAEMKESEMRGLLIRADAVRSAWSTKISSVRDVLLQIPSRLAPVLAAESEIGRVTELLEDALRQALAHLAAARIGQQESEE